MTMYNLSEYQFSSNFCVNRVENATQNMIVSLSTQSIWMHVSDHNNRLQKSGSYLSFYYGLLGLSG